MKLKPGHWALIGLLVTVAAVAAATQLPDVKRYIRMKTM
ncbi:MAG: hypothetical protein JWL77_5241 [Chthonomonadaceae bacterium]|nr:hypothetical protein [Chthonomonadaceae bacterium]